MHCQKIMGERERERGGIDEEEEGIRPGKWGGRDGEFGKEIVYSDGERNSSVTSTFASLDELCACVFVCVCVCVCVYVCENIHLESPDPLVCVCACVCIYA